MKPRDEEEQQEIYHIVLIGCPGSGKTTQCEKLVYHFTPDQCFKYEMGALLKQFCEQQQVKEEEEEESIVEAKQLINQLIKRGKLKTQVPVHVIETVWNHVLTHQVPKTTKICLYYGGPMTVEEAQRLIIKPHLVIVLECPSHAGGDQILVDRVCHRRIDALTGKTYHLINDRHVLQQLNILNDSTRLRCRLGDDEMFFRQRLTRFKQRSEPILQFYEQVLGRSRVLRIDATQSVDHIHHIIKTSIQKTIESIK